MSDEAPAHFLWLPPHLRPPIVMNIRQERIFLLVGVAALFAGYDLNIFGLATLQIQESLHIPEDRIAPTLAMLRLAVPFALMLCASADIVGRRRLLLVTILGQAVATLATAFAGDYGQFVGAQFATRLFGYAEEMLCFVVIAEEVAAAARGWASGTLSAMYYTGTGIASLIFAAVNLMPYGWRAIYVIGSVPLFLVAYLRRRLPETRRFAREHGADQMAGARPLTAQAGEALTLLRRLAVEHPRRLAAILVAVAGFGFASAPAALLASKVLQSVFHYSPGEVTMLLVPGGLVGLVLSIFTGRLSDRIGRKRVAFAMAALMAVCFFFLYGGAGPRLVPPLWILGFFGYFSCDSLLAGFAIEIVPTSYRATVSGLRYLVEIAAGAAALTLEGRWYDAYGAHGPAIQMTLIAIPVCLLAILFLPEPAGRTLEEMAE